MAGGFYNRPTAVEAVFNRLFGFLVRFGIGLPHNYLLIVRGRKSGKEYSNPVDVLDFRGRRFLVAGRGETQWVRNVRASGEVVLKKGRRAQSFSAVAVADEENPEILKAYLGRFRLTVARYFPVAPEAPIDAFRPLASRYPVFELRPK
jgi:deazaflavin-dependent oxidoreductase (nitroreductase family)